MISPYLLHTPDFRCWTTGPLETEETRLQEWPSTSEEVEVVQARLTLVRAALQERRSKPKPASIPNGLRWVTTETIDPDPISALMDVRRKMRTILAPQLKCVSSRLIALLPIRHGALARLEPLAPLEGQRVAALTVAKKLLREAGWELTEDGHVLSVSADPGELE